MIAVNIIGHNVREYASFVDSAIIKTALEVADNKRPTGVLAATRAYQRRWNSVIKQGANVGVKELKNALALTGTNDIPKSISDTQLTQLWNAIPDATRGVEPYIITNRRTDEALRMLRSDDRFISMLDHAANGKPRGSENRLAVEAALKTANDPVDMGATASPTWYASLQFDTPNAPRSGLGEYGRVGFEFKPSVAAQSTILPADSFAMWAPPARSKDPVIDAMFKENAKKRLGSEPSSSVAAVEQLRSVLMHRMLRDFPSQAANSAYDSPWVTAFFNAKTNEARSDAVRSFLSGSTLKDSLASRKTFLEVQVQRAVSMNDVKAIRVANRFEWPRSDPPLSEAKLDEIRDAARKWGIPVTIETK